MERFGIEDLSVEIQDRLIFEQRLENIKRFLIESKYCADIDHRDMDRVVSFEHAAKMIEERDADYTENGDFIADADGFNFDMVVSVSG